MTRNYLKNLNSAAGNMAKSNERISSGRKYTKISENVSDGTKALKVREDLYKNEQYITNIKNAENDLSSAESNLKSITEILQTAQERTIKGMNGSISESDRKIISEEIRAFQNQVLQTANAQFGDKFLFSGTNNGQPPFDISDDGDVLYNGVPVNEITMTDGVYYDKDGEVIPQNEKMYIDIGLGIKMTGDHVDPTSAFETSFSGLEVIGFGTTDGMANNVIELLGDIADLISPKPPEVYDSNEVGKSLDHLKAQTDSVVSNTSDIGSRCNFLEKTVDRIESDTLNLEGYRTDLESTDSATEIMNMKMYEYAWMATLKMGAEIIPVSLMDFVK